LDGGQGPSSCPFFSFLEAQPSLSVGVKPCCLCAPPLYPPDFPPMPGVQRLRRRGFLSVLFVSGGVIDSTSALDRETRRRKCARGWKTVRLRRPSPLRVSPTAGSCERRCARARARALVRVASSACREEYSRSIIPGSGCSSIDVHRDCEAR